MSYLILALIYTVHLNIDVHTACVLLCIANSKVHEKYISISNRLSSKYSNCSILLSSSKNITGCFQQLVTRFVVQNLARN